MSYFSLYPNLIYLPGHILDKKGISAVFKQKGKRQLTSTKMKAFQ